MTNFQSETNEDERQFDYIVVGGGASAMGLVHGLLSRFTEESPPFTIAVMDRGSDSPASITETPNQWCNASHKKQSSVELLESTIGGNRIIDVPVGKGLGGTTNINACLCCPPARDDFASWPKPWDTAIASAVEVIQDAMMANDCLYLHDVGSNPYETPSKPEKSTTESCVKSVATFPSLVTQVPLSVQKKDGEEMFVRRSYYDALVEPLLREFPHVRKSISFICNFKVQRLLFSGDNSHVIGVKGLHNRRVYARRQVILCAGAIESPALLLVSGIGHEQDLFQVGISPKRRGSQTGVGRRLRDHVLVPRVFLSPWSPRVRSPNGVHALCYASSKSGNRFQFIMNDSTVYSQLIPHFVASLVRRRFTQPIVNIILNGVFLTLRTLLTLLVSYSPLYFIFRYFIITMNVALLNPSSNGSVSIRRRVSCDDMEAPIGRKDVDVVVDAGYLKESCDIAALYEGWNMSSERFRPFLDKCIELLPGFLFRWITIFHGDDSSSDDFWFRTYAFHFALPYFHWHGSCAMKTDENEEWVVDSNFRVRDFSGLLVCDASVFPTTISGPTALTCASLGHALASKLLLINDKEKKNL